MSREHYEILVCSGPTCAGERHADQVYARLIDEVDGRALQSVVRTGRRKCFGFCRRGPNVYVRSLSPGPTRRSALYHGVAASDTSEVLERHVLGHQIIDRLLTIPPDPDDPDDHDHGRTDIRLAVATTEPAESHAEHAAVRSKGKEEDR